MKAKQILVVDDDPDVRISVRAVLEDAGYAVAEASNGREALDLLTQGGLHPQVVLLDLVMPEMNGRTFIEELGNLPFAAEVAVIVLSAHPQMRHAAASMKVARYLKKPVRRQELMKALAGVEPSLP